MKKKTERNTAKTQRGQGDYMGAGVPQKIGRIIDVFGQGDLKASKNFGKPPKSLA